MSKWGSSMDLNTFFTEDLSTEEKLRYAYAQVLRNLAWKIEHYKNEVTGEYVCFVPWVIRAKIITENLDSMLVLECLEADE